MPDYDVVILGAGAAGMMAAAFAGRRGRSVLVVDHARAPGEKIRISGGGRCNFTNLNATTKLGRGRFLSDNPRFALSALSRYTPADFIALVDRYGIAWHEKALGQLFCDGSATQIVNLLTTELRQAGAALKLASAVEGVERAGEGFTVRLADGPVAARAVIVATVGKSIPKMGASAFGYRLAEQFGLAVTETRPGLVPLTFEPGALKSLSPLAGIAVDASVAHGRIRFSEPLLFTHRGLSGPAILQISSYWREGDAITIDLMGGRDLVPLLQAARQETPRLAVQTVLAGLLPRRVVHLRLGEEPFPAMIGDCSDRLFRTLAERFSQWSVKPVGSEGYRTAEVTLGGVSTEALDARTLEARQVPGLYFIGEVVDVTGWLGGYNFQWAWASAKAAGEVA